MAKRKKARSATKKAAKRVKRPKRAKVAPRRRRPAARATRAAAPRGLASDVEAALRARGYDPPDRDVVATIATVGTGYREGPAADPPIPIAFDVDAEVADALVDRYVDGDRPSELDRTVHRPSVRATVDMNVDQLGLEAGETARATLTSLALGAWDPARDEVAKRNAIAGFIVRWYGEGLA
jgi:hypothetical protein